MVLLCQYNSIVNILSADSYKLAERGNQVWNLSDPVTVTEERISESIVQMHEKEREAMILEPGNLLGMARLNFRWKCNNQFWGIRSPEMLSAFVSGHFLWNNRLFRRIIQIKWQAILLRMKPFPPRIYERIIFYPGVASLPLKQQLEFSNRNSGIFFTIF